ncbi:Regulatory protein cro (Antirepressor) [Serratia proteamaculans]|uniref:Cro/CI family transcriptional regulator n=1 Tax=Serratia proteamaculans TaxID=28151 RepID=UPI0009F7C13B|nr:Cro/CI family transcriptional regulator [Serratia proteamaculans]SMB46680.1 Regulatory protein cro (Antirepressor) [Serratia proteamaculans]
MLKKDVVKHFTTQKEVARFLGLSDSAVSQWKEVIPEKDAHRLHKGTKGVLRFNPSLYKKSTAPAA